MYRFAAACAALALFTIAGAPTFAPIPKKMAAGRSARTPVPAEAAPKTKPFTVVVLGSSTAAGIGARPVEMSWVNRYAAALRAANPESTVVNRAVPGYATYHVMPTGFAAPSGRPATYSDRNITYALSLHPDAIILNLPSNDAALGYTLDETEANFSAIAAEAWKAHVPLWVTTPQPRNLPPDQRASQVALRDWIRRKFQDHTLDFWTGLATPDGSILKEYDSGDGVHLNNAGHALLYGRVIGMDLPEKSRQRRKAAPVPRKVVPTRKTVPTRKAAPVR